MCRKEGWACFSGLSASTYFATKRDYSLGLQCAFVFVCSFASPDSQRRQRLRDMAEVAQLIIVHQLTTGGFLGLGNPRLVSPAPGRAVGELMGCDVNYGYGRQMDILFVGDSERVGELESRRCLGVGRGGSEQQSGRHPQDADEASDDLPSHAQPISRSTK
ncbi:hypothetical protein SODALDRAFT_133286 [Sodiomyces alkalinus F11]|uniref:Uncharacterized protein n=1 Tax=Sodiomyces alkalinus (strain CBS 110278 / VKM F-3762 / F11) TaxID=1314773 RepID=A0A3N2PYG7_SODAK|nr:hypothetical protein SODALDRAFT_133286 [Sodiomyces alkalinus F11]ROT39581.1 hypothetical protein SODALDRAFT_133286 [Sodiomyces alkalinus F11]